MLQNRVDPFGHIIRTKARGLWMGNRGLLHNEKQEVLRPFRLKAWITCTLEFKGWHRKVMSPNKYTELFFMDEAMAFAAGHRPCFECRRDDYNRFKSFWLKGNSEYNFEEKVSIQQIDDILHNERINSSKEKVTYQEDATAIPNGALVLFKNEPYLILNGAMYLWTPFGYQNKIVIPDVDRLDVLTPRSVVNTFRAGYVPQIAIKMD